MRELYTASANPVARELVEANHELQATRILQVLELDDTPRHRLAAGGWLALVEFTGRRVVEGAPRDDAVDLCITALVALLGQDLA